MDSVDEIAGVLAHELGHIVNKTFEHSSVTSHSPAGVGWVHESASDSMAPQMLEKLGLNSLALSEALKKITTGSRDFEHQSGLVRSTQSVGMHLGVDYATSTAGHTQIPEFLKGEKARDTNAEIIEKAIEAEHFEIVCEHLEFITPQNLRLAYDRLRDPSYVVSGKYRNEKTGKCDYPENFYIALNRFRDYFSSRLSNTDLTQVDINTYFYLDEQKHVYDFSYIKSPQDLIDIFKNLPRSMTINDSIKNELFGEVISQYSYWDPDRPFRVLDNYAFKKEGDQHAFECSEVTFLEVLKTSEIVYGGSSRSKEVTHAVLNYLIRRYSSAKYGSLEKNVHKIPRDEYGYEIDLYKLDKVGARQFLSRVEDAGIGIDWKTVQEWVGSDSDKPNPNFEYCQDVQKIISEIYGFGDGPEIVQLDYIAEADKFLTQFEVLKTIDEKLKTVVGFLNALDRVDVVELTDAQKEEVLNYIFERFDQMDFGSEAMPLSKVKRDSMLWPTAEEMKWEQVEGLMTPELKRYAVKEAMVLGTFEKDSEQFYRLLDAAMQKAQPGFEALDWGKQADFMSNLLLIDKGKNNFYVIYSPMFLAGDEKVIASGATDVENYSRLCSLPFFESFARKVPSVSGNSVVEVIQFGRDLGKGSYLWQKRKGRLYDDDLVNLVMGAPIRQSFEDLVAGGIDQSDYNELAQFINSNFPDSPRTQSLLRQIDKHYLYSEAGLGDKCDYLEGNFDRVGFEGMVIVADEIVSLEDYRYFRDRMGKRMEKYLSGSSSLDKLAATDFITSYASVGQRTLFKSARDDRKSRRETTSDFATVWADFWLKEDRYNKGAKYNKNSGKFELDALFSVEIRHS